MEVIVTYFFFVIVVGNGFYGWNFSCPFEVKFGPAHIKNQFQTEKLAFSQALIYVDWSVIQLVGPSIEALMQTTSTACAKFSKTSHK